MDALTEAHWPALLARFPLEIHIWTIPLLFATGWIIGYVHFRDSLHRKHPDLWREWRRRTHPGETPDEPDEDNAPDRDA